MRATFAASGERIDFAPSAHIDIPFEDLSSLAPAERDARVRSAIDFEGRTPFDLLNGPVLRLRLFRLEPESHALVFTSHHIVCDGWSINVLLDELSQLYPHGSITAASICRFPCIRDYARDQAQQSRDRQFRRASNRIGCSSSRSFRRCSICRPIARIPAVKTFQGSTYRARIDADTYKLIKQAGAKQGCTLFSTLLGSFAALCTA